MTTLVMRANKVKTTEKLDTTPFIASDVETFPATGKFRYAHFYGFYRRKTSVRGADGKSLTDWNYYLVDRGFFDQDEAVRFMLSFGQNKKYGRPCKFVFFNLSHDYWYFHKAMREDSLLIAGGRFIACELLNGVEVFDISNHSPGETLDSWITSCKMGDPDNNICKEAIFKTEYREDMTDEEIVKHCRWDAMATFEMTEWWRRFLNGYNLDLKLTIGSQAIDAQTRMFFKNERGKNYYFFRDDGDEANNFIQQGYYGGRTEAWYGYRHELELACYDINSTYPSEMIKQKFPDPSTLRWGSLADTMKDAFSKEIIPKWRWCLDHRQGFFECDVYVPKTNIPVLPVRENAKLMFKWGNLHGVWASEELRYAEKCGAEILKCHRFLWYNRSIPFFREFEQWCVDKRNEMKKRFGKKSPQEQAFKRLGNSAYGKYGQRVSDDSYVGTVSGFNDSPKMHDKTFINPSFVDGEWLVSYTGSRKVWSEKSFVEIAAYTTMFARLALTKGAHAVEATGLIPAYCDTDSLKIASPNGTISEADIATIAGVLDVGDKLGQWENEGVQKRYLGAPKVILVEDENGNIDLSDPKNRIKGLKKGSKTEIFWAYDETHGNRYIDRIEAITHKPIRLKEGIRTKQTPGKWIDRFRIDRLLESKRIWDGKKSEAIFSPVLPPPASCESVPLSSQNQAS